MRDFKGMKRQRSRNRNPGGGGGGGNKPQQHNANRAFDSNGPEGAKVRGAAQSVYEKYQQLARDAQTAGDRVLAENYLQHAEHYFRLLRAMQPLRPLSEIIGRDQFVSGYDIDFEDESVLEAAEAAEAQQQQQEQADAADGERRQDNSRQDNRQSEYRQPEYRQNEFRRDERPRDDRYQGDRSSNDRAPSQNDRNQNDRNQNDRNQNDRNQGDRYQNDRNQSGQGQQGDRPRNDRSRDDRGQRPYRDDRPRYDDNRARDERPREERQQSVEAVAEAPPAQPEYPVANTPAPAPEVRSPEPASMLRADDGEVSAAPAFLQARPAGEGGEEVRRPRRRRAPASFEPAPAQPAED
jgi:hypothetical protein